MLTETMSDILARRYIRAACAEIRNATRAARTKRDEFYETWWFWTAVGVVVAGTTTGILLAVLDEDEPPVVQTGTLIIEFEGLP